MFLTFLVSSRVAEPLQKELNSVLNLQRLSITEPSRWTSTTNILDSRREEGSPAPGLKRSGAEIAPADERSIEELMPSDYLLLVG